MRRREKSKLRGNRRVVKPSAKRVGVLLRFLMDAEPRAVKENGTSSLCKKAILHSLNPLKLRQNEKIFRKGKDQIASVKNQIREEKVLREPFVPELIPDGFAVP